MKHLKHVGMLLVAFFVSTAVFAQSAPQKTAPFSRYRKANGLVFVSGQIGITDSTSGKGNFPAEVNQTMKNIAAILAEAGTSFDNVVSVTVYLRNMKQFATFNQIYLQYFKQPYPARACVAVADLVLDANVEISVIATEK